LPGAGVGRSLERAPKDFTGITDPAKKAGAKGEVLAAAEEE